MKVRQQSTHTHKSRHISNNHMLLIETETLNVSETKTKTTTYTPLILKSITGGSCHKHHFCHDKHVFVVTKHVFCHDKSMLAATKLLSQQNYICCDHFCCCCDKNFVMTSILLSWQKTCFVVTKVSLSQQNYVCRDKYLLREIFCCNENVCHDKSFVATTILLLQQNTSFVAKNYTYGSSRQWYKTWSHQWP